MKGRKTTSQPADANGASDLTFASHCVGGQGSEDQAAPPDDPAPRQGRAVRWQPRNGVVALVPGVSARIDPSPAPGRPIALPAAVVIAIAGIEEWCAEDGKVAMVVMEEGVAANEVAAVPAGAGEARGERGMRSHRPAGKAGTTEMPSAEMRTPKVSAAHAHAAHVHPAATEMAAAAEAAMSAAAKTTAAAAREHGRSNRQRSGERRCDETGEKPVGHRKVLHAMRRALAAQGGPDEAGAGSSSTYKCARF